MLADDTDEDAAICYYMFINHGTLPHEIMNMSVREKAFVLAMIRREIKSRPKK